MTASEEILVARAKTGDRSAFDDLVGLNRARLESWIRSRISGRLRHKVDVDDLIQETLLRALKSVSRFSWRGDGSFGGWLCTIAEHLIWNVSQRRSTDEIRLTSELPDSHVSPSRHLRRGERLDRLEKSMEGLRPEERAALQLSRVEGLKVSEVAERLNKTESAVKSLITRSLRKLRESFGDTESLHLPNRGLDSEEKEHDG